MKILIIGASGQIGKGLYTLFKSRGEDVIGTGCLRKIGTTKNASSFKVESLDLGDSRSITKIFEHVRPTHVFLSAALANVDYCEDHPEEAHKINVTGTEFVVEACRLCEAKLIYLSTDYVFDGVNGPYTEDDSPAPISVYGQTKWEAEKVVQTSRDALIIRTTLVYDWDMDSKNFAMTLIRNLSENKPMRIVNDQLCNPTLARDLCSALADLVSANASGVFNVVGCDYVSRFEFAKIACCILGFDEHLITPIQTKESGQKAPRPLKGGLITEKIEKTINRSLVGIAKGLEAVKNDRESIGLEHAKQ